MIVRKFVFTFTVKLAKLTAAYCLFMAIGTFSCSSARNSSTAPGFRELRDDLGRAVRLPLRIERAVSLAPNLTEIVFAVGAEDRLVGVTTYCDFPAEARAIAKVGDTQTPNVERIIALKPDLVLVSTSSQLEAFADTLASRNIAVFVTNPTNFSDVMKNLERLGELFGTQAKAQALIDKLNSRAASAEEKYAKRSPVRVFVQISKEPLYTIGKSSFLTELLTRVGGDVVTKNVETAFPVLSKETALALAPDAIILSDSSDNTEPNEAFRNSPAVKNEKVFRVNADILSRPGPRLVDAMEIVGAHLNGMTTTSNIK